MTCYLTILVFSFVYVVLLPAQSIPIEDIWKDTNRNWTNTAGYIIGSLTTYHGWFGKTYNGNVWFRNFSCINYSTVTVNFTCNYGCGVEDSGVNRDYCVMYFNDPTHSTYAINISYDEGENVDHTNDETEILSCSKYHGGQSFSATAATFTDSELYFLLDQEFEVAFATYLTADFADEYLGISFISIKCNKNPIQPTLSPTTSNPTTLPTINPSAVPTQYPSLSPSSQPTFQPSFYPTSLPTVDPSVDPSSGPTKYPNAHPTQNPSSYPSKYPSAFPTVFPSNIPTTTPTIDGNSIALGGKTESMDALTLGLIIGFSVLGLFVILTVIFIVCYLRSKRQEKNPSFKAVGNRSINMVVAELPNDTMDTCIAYDGQEDEEKAVELQCAQPKSNDFNSRNIISNEDTFTISCNETAGGVGWNEEFQ